MCSGKRKDLGTLLSLLSSFSIGSTFPDYVSIFFVVGLLLLFETSPLGDKNITSSRSKCIILKK